MLFRINVIFSFTYSSWYCLSKGSNSRSNTSLKGIVMLLGVSDFFGYGVLATTIYCIFWCGGAGVMDYYY